MTVKKIISGGQTGADQGGLAAAKELDLQTGGWAPIGWNTEVGAAKELLLSYGLVECKSGYNERTYLNVHDSDGTVLFGSTSSPGSKLTLSYCISSLGGKPYIVNPTQEEFRKWLKKEKIETLNIAGNRESVSRGIGERVRSFLVEALGSPKRE